MQIKRSYLDSTITVIVLMIISVEYNQNYLTNNLSDFDAVRFYLYLMIFSLYVLLPFLAKRKYRIDRLNLYIFAICLLFISVVYVDYGITLEVLRNTLSIMVVSLIMNKVIKRNGVEAYVLTVLITGIPFYIYALQNGDDLRTSSWIGGPSSFITYLLVVYALHSIYIKKKLRPMWLISLYNLFLVGSGKGLISFLSFMSDNLKKNILFMLIIPLTIFGFIFIRGIESIEKSLTQRFLRFTENVNPHDTFSYYYLNESFYTLIFLTFITFLPLFYLVFKKMSFSHRVYSSLSAANVLFIYLLEVMKIDNTFLISLVLMNFVTILRFANHN